jgi:sarcosine oxidase/L-pipecolate oxidase
MATAYTPPSSIIIVGSGVFGLSLAYALAQSPSHASTRIVVLDRSPFPSPDGSSVDSSRIIRADYSIAAYTALAALAQNTWRQQGPGELGGEGRYSETGLTLVSNFKDDIKPGTTEGGYVKQSYENVLNLTQAAGEVGAISELKDRAAIKACVGAGEGSGEWGYINRSSGWADAEESMKWLRAKVEATGRVEFQLGEAESLVRSGKKVTGVKLVSGEVKSTDIVVLATGAWTGKLVDLTGRASATGQVLAYINLTPEEQERYGKMPTLLNLSTGMFIITPTKNVLKVARHGYGYTNPTTIPNPDGAEKGSIEVSLPRTSYDVGSQDIPSEGQAACRAALREMVPELGDRAFTKTRICWYTDTPEGDFLFDYHPDFEGLFLATGGSGHGFKFLPVIGDKIVQCLERQCPVEFRGRWQWPKEKAQEVVTLDGSRGGPARMILDTEMAAR